MPTDGKKLDNRYLIRREVGSGGFGAVYLAEDTRFTGNNVVAIKKMPQGNEQTAAAFRHEANLLYNLSHANLPKVTNCFQEDNANFIVMDYIAGEDLMQQLKRGKRFSVAEVLAIADKVLDALEYLHSFSIFHRDIKPHNIKIDERGGIYLLDFGTAKGQVDDATLPLTGQSITGYTPSYAPLEQVLRVDANSYLLLKSIDSPNFDLFEQHKTDARSDIYSLGATIYHLLTGYSPERATATIRAHLLWSGKPDSLPDCRSLNPEISASLAESINKSLEIEPANRFQTAAEFREALRNLSVAGAGQTNESPQFETQISPLITSPNSRQPTQPDGDPFKVEISPDFSPADSIQTLFKKDASPKSKGKFAVFAVGAFVLLAVTAGFGGWFLWRNSKTAPEQPKTNSQAETIVQPDVQKSQTLSYSLLVQKMRDGKKFQEPFESSGQEIFESGYQFQIYLTPPADGVLYVFAEGLNEKGEKIFAVNFPTPQRNNGKADVAAGQKYESGWNEFSGQPGTENYWIIFGKQKLDAPEQARENAFASNGIVSDREKNKKLKDFLEGAKNTKASISKDADKKLTKIDYQGDSIVYMIGLEHR